MRNSSNHLNTLAAYLMVAILSACQGGDNQNVNEDPVENARSYELSMQWTMSDSLHRPETVIFDRANNCYYVSNALEFDFTSTGYIAKIDMEGRLVSKNWLAGLNRPTGMAISGDKLYIGDMDRVVAVNTGDSSIIATYPLPRDPFPGINDVAIAPDGNVFASASSLHAVVTIEDESLQIWAQDTTSLKWANGLLATDDRLYVAGLQLSTINYQTQEIQQLSLTPAINDFDGLESDGSGGFFTSSAGPGVNTIWHIDENQKTTVVTKGDNYFGDFDYLPELDLLVTPSGNNESRRYSVVLFRMQNSDN